MIIELILIGILVGTISGFFGVGGGMILVPILMAIGFDIKSAIGISVVQMVFSSVYGSYLNWKKGLLVLNEGIWVGVGGVMGGVVGAGFTNLLSKDMLEYIFFGMILFALFRILFSKPYDPSVPEGNFSSMTLLGIGFSIGIVAMMLGVGGSVMLTPILVGFLHFSTKKAATAGLFFVVFSSISGLFYKLYTDTFIELSLDVSMVLSLAVAALLGSWIGIWLKSRVKDTHHKRYLLLMYFVILGLLIRKIWL